MRHVSVLLVLLTLVGACESKSPAPTTTSPSRPRIASVSPAVGVLLADLHYDHLCVGRDGHDMVLQPSIPVIGDQTRLDYEALIAARPTLVLTQWGSRDLPPRLVELANANHWKLIDSRLLTLEDIRDSTMQLDRELCAATSVLAPSEACRHLLARMDAAWSSAGKDYSALGRILLLAEPSPPAAFGPGSCHYQVLERLGVQPAITSGAAYINLTLEDILPLAPDAIILINPRPPNTPARSSEDLQKLCDAKLASIAALDIPAAKAQRMALIDDPLGFIPSTSMIRVAEEIRTVFDGWASGR
jgi:ABC-type hemin transport system substrate-binding protein